MLTFDQVLLLQEKIESAANKIKQLQAENDALRSKCAELTNALSSKSELLSNFETEQSKIENGILNALNRLNVIENSLLHSADNSSQQKVEQTKISVQRNNELQNQQIQNPQQQVVQPQQIQNPQIQEQQKQENQQFEQNTNSEQNDFQQSFSDFEDSEEINQTENTFDNAPVQQEENSSTESDQFDIF